MIKWHVSSYVDMGRLYGSEFALSFRAYCNNTASSITALYPIPVLPLSFSSNQNVTLDQTPFDQRRLLHEDQVMASESESQETIVRMCTVTS